MMKIEDILRHRHDLALPRAQIAAAVGVSTGTVSHVLARAEAAGLSWPLPDDLDDDALRARLYARWAPRYSRVVLRHALDSNASTVCRRVEGRRGCRAGRPGQLPTIAQKRRAYRFDMFPEKAIPGYS